MKNYRVIYQNGNETITIDYISSSNLEEFSTQIGLEIQNNLVPFKKDLSLSYTVEEIVE